MDLKQFYSIDNKKVSFSRERASQFAKSVAGDFNPIHDVDAKRFCVPGDLLFAVVITELGVSRSMRFDFKSMVTEQTKMNIPEHMSNEISFFDQNDKSLLTVHCSGEHSKNSGFIDSLIEQYVTFSGRTFPEILVNLMIKNNIMINPARPLVIYKAMALDINEFTEGAVELKFSGSSMMVDGKKGNVKLEFDLFAYDRKIGQGTKDMAISGLRLFEKAAIDMIVNDYNATKQAYLA